MKSLIILSLLSAIAYGIVCGAYLAFPPDILNKDFYEFYSSNLRSELFAGFLSLAGFLFALKTFIIVTMKKEVYDDDFYDHYVAKAQNLDSSYKRYGPLQRLSLFLYTTIWASVITAVLQPTLGLWNHWFSALTCISVGVYTLALLVTSLILMNKNLRALFKHWEEKKAKPTQQGD